MIQTVSYASPLCKLCDGIKKTLSLSDNSFGFMPDVVGGSTMAIEQLRTADLGTLRCCLDTDLELYRRFMGFVCCRAQLFVSTGYTRGDCDCSQYLN